MKHAHTLSGFATPLLHDERLVHFQNLSSDSYDYKFLLTAKYSRWFNLCSALKIVEAILFWKSGNLVPSLLMPTHGLQL